MINDVEVQSGPEWVPPMSAATSGVDFLGLRQVNLELASHCIPGISNATTRVRPFSVATWINWKFRELLIEQGRDEAEAAEFTEFREKVESLLAWGHQLRGISGVPGVLAKPPAAESGRLSLSFDAWGRTYSSNGLQAAAQYGPALKSPYGLGFLSPVGERVSHPTTVGEKLARALDDALRRTSSYGLLDKLGSGTARQSDAESLMDVWQVDGVTAREAGAFRQGLYEESAINDQDSRGRRSAMIYSILALLEQSRRALSEDEIRFGLAALMTNTGRQLRLPEFCVTLCRHWKTLQVRQAQRTALEALLAWFEAALQEGETSLDGIWAKLETDLGHERYSRGGTLTCDAALRAFARGLPDETEYLTACVNGDDRNVISGMSALRSDAREDPAAGVPDAVRILLGVVMWTHWLKEDVSLDRHLKLGGPDRVSLWVYHNTFHRFGTEPTGSWLRDVLERTVIGQHLRVATMRFDGGTSRQRFGFGEHGLEFYASDPAVPMITGDHLAALLSLMVDARLIQRDGDRYALT